MEVALGAPAGGVRIFTMEAGAHLLPAGGHQHPAPAVQKGRSDAGQIGKILQDISNFLDIQNGGQGVWGFIHCQGLNSLLG